MNLSFVKENVDLSKYASNRTGGFARYFAEPSSDDEVRELFEFINDEGLDWFVLGGGSNVLIPSSGFDGVIVHPSFKDISVDGVHVVAGSGVSLGAVAAKSAKEGLTGLEFGAVIPGTVGGAVYGNAGAYEREMKDVVSSLRFYDPESGKFIEKDKGELSFGYRHSQFKERRALILSVELELEKGDMHTIEGKIEEYRDHRKETQPLEYPSTGCVFKNPSDNAAGKLIDKAGLKGYRVGDAQVSEKHANFIVNVGHATAEDIEAVRLHVKEVVKEQSGVELEEENILL